MDGCCENDGMTGIFLYLFFYFEKGGNVTVADYLSTVKDWQKYPITSISDLEQRLDHFRILFAYHSGKIENDEITYHDTREIFENGKVLNYTGNPRSIFEQQNQKLCYEFLKQKIVAKEPLTSQLVLEIHRILTSGTFDERRFLENGERPGEYKRHDYVTGRQEVGSCAEDVAQEIEELLEEVNGYDGKEVVRAGAYFHAVLEHIRPFADGNGRVGRALLNYYLMIHNHPPLVIYDEDKALYYECLEKYDREETIIPLTEFLKYETEETWAATLERNRKKKERKFLEEIR